MPQTTLYLNLMKLFLVSLTVWKHNLHDFLTINAIKKLYSLVLEQSMVDNIVKNILKIDEAGTKCLEKIETIRSIFGSN